jgi:hypothetical protein
MAGNFTKKEVQKTWHWHVLGSDKGLIADVITMVGVCASHGEARSKKAG